MTSLLFWLLLLFVLGILNDEEDFLQVYNPISDSRLESIEELVASRLLMMIGSFPGFLQPWRSLLKSEELSDEVGDSLDSMCLPLLGLKLSNLV